MTDREEELAEREREVESARHGFGLGGIAAGPFSVPVIDTRGDANPIDEVEIEAREARERDQS